MSLAYLYYHQYEGLTFGDFYTTVSGASLAFSAGSLIYYIRQNYTLSNRIALLFIVIFILHFFLAHALWDFDLKQNVWGTLYTMRYYGLPLHSVLSGLLLWALLDFEAQMSKQSRIEKFGTQLGKLAYAVFLCHWIIAYMLHNIGIDFANKALFIPLAFIGINLMAVFLYRYVEYPLDKKFRDKIRGRKAPT